MPVSSGRITKSRKSKGPSTHGKNHRWESFHTKIAQLSALDPLHRVRRHDLDAEDISTATSYFRQGLQRWSELNMSRGFVAFKRGALPISESLPQLLHFEDRIMTLLDEGISTTDKESLEPLLELLTAFARDLGVRFEKYYERSLSLIRNVLATPQEAEVIEWTFGALAWLFKYLWRLLVPNLCPTYDALAPLLGRTRHPPHIARFAAEALSFLIKKAAAPSNRETALQRIVNHVRDDLSTMVDDRQFMLYRDGVMTMFAETIRGTGESIYTSGPACLGAMLDAMPDTERQLDQTTEPMWTGVICGALTSVMHGSNADNMAEIVTTIVDHIGRDRVVESTLPPLVRSLPWFQVLGTLVGVRGGSRIQDWASVVDILVKITQELAETKSALGDEARDQFWQRVVVNIAIVWNQAPMDALIKHKMAHTRAMTTQPCMPWFVPFCAYMQELDSGKFDSLFRQDLQKSVLRLESWRRI